MILKDAEIHDKLLIFIQLKFAETHDKLLILTVLKLAFVLLKFCRFVNADVTLML